MKTPLEHSTSPGKERIRERAFELGFAACGFTGADALPDRALLADWIAAERHGSMDYLDRDLRSRVDPSLALPGARSVIVTAWPYRAAPIAGDLRESLRGRIAGYARGIDYHDGLAAKLDELASVVGAEFGGATRVHVDAGPLLEKSLARRAGLGWYGRNTNLLLPDRGSYVLLACLLCDAPIEPDAPFETDHCGACTACVPACPTGALDDGPTIDARLCISYLTIEHRGPIAPELRPLMGSWVFGCDDCQTICPWNDDDGVADPWLLPALPELIAISPEQFDADYRRTAVARTKRRGLARNAAVALGNSGQPAAVSPLAAALREHDEALVRAHAAWGLGRFSCPPAVKALEAAARSERVPPVRVEIEDALRASKTSRPGD